MAAQRPLAKIRAGSVSCALWENQINVNGTPKAILKASIERRYKDKDGDWQSSASFGRSEIPLAIFCLARAFDKIINEETTNNGAEEVIE